MAKIIGIRNSDDTYSVTPLIVTSSISSGKITDIINHKATGAANLYDCRIGLNVVKTKTDAGGAGTFDSFIRGRVNPNMGGYYYAYAFDGTTYVDASCRIPLSQCSVGNISGKRRAYVSMGVACNGRKFRYFDVGIANDGNGWYPYVYGNNVYQLNSSGGYTLDPDIQYYHTGNMVVKTKNGEIGTPLPANGIVTLKLETGLYTDRDYVRFTYTCGALTGTIAFNAVKETMHVRSNNKAKARFYRFMSVVPLIGHGENDNADNSALSAVIDTLKLGTTSWTADKIQHSYACQTENVKTVDISTLTPAGIGGDADYCHIYHDTPTHPVV